MKHKKEENKKKQINSFLIDIFLHSFFMYRKAKEREREELYMNKLVPTGWCCGMETYLS